MSTNFWELLQQHQNDLTKSGHMVADYLVQHAAEAQYLSISSLARECKVAEATVFRFCRALGFEGYLSLRAYGLGFCGSLCALSAKPEVGRPRAGAGGFHRLYPAVPVCALPHRCAGRPCAGHCTGFLRLVAR